VLPVLKASPRRPAVAIPTAVDPQPFDPTHALRLMRAQWRYQRLVRLRGLAAALVFLQRDYRATASEMHDVDGTILLVRRASQVLRRAYHQGDTARDCLYRSMAVASVLLKRGVSADLCIGVIGVPFAAHAWVEANDWVVNEDVETCRKFTVIGRF
jgi:hypothetical protein